MDRQVIERYAAGAPRLRAAIEGLTPTDLNAFPVLGTWSISQIVFHMLESDAIGTDRMKRIVGMDNPLLMGYDETLFARRLPHDRMDIQLACELFEKNRRHNAELLRLLPDEAFARSGIHSERGRVTLLDTLVTNADHLEHHLEFVRQKRELLASHVAGTGLAAEEAGNQENMRHGGR